MNDKKERKGPLLDNEIKGLRPKDKPYRRFDGIGNGLYLEVMPSGSKKWRLVYRYDGKYKCISLGTYPDTSLKSARMKATDQKRILETGKDPLAEKHYIAPEELTFARLAEEWQGRFFPPLAPKTRKKKQEHLSNYILPAIGHLPVNQVTPAVLLDKLLRPIEAVGFIETVHRAKMLCGQIFRYGIATGQADRDPTQDLRGAIRPNVSKHRATILDSARIGQLLDAIDIYNGYIVVRYALKLTPLLFLRPGELRHIQWTEINWDDSVIRIPAEKMKMNKPHIVPLASQSIKLLQELRHISGCSQWLFPGQRKNGRPISDMAVNVALRNMGFGSEEISAHGFRAMASTILNERGYNRDWIERQLAHTEQDGVRAAYNYAEYLPERRNMMQDWANYLDGLKN